LQPKRFLSFKATTGDDSALTDDNETVPKTAATRLSSIRYKRFDDLVKFVSMTPQPFLNHMERDGRHIYFFLLPFSGGLVVSYFAADKKVDGEFITINRMSGRFSASNKPTFDAQSLDLPILEVEATDILDSIRL
jgi:hypothetical protein